MKFLKQVISILIFCSSFILHSQTIELSFTGICDAIHISVDSILVENITQGGDTVLYYPDTTLTLDVTTGVDEAIWANESLRVTQNYPNPLISNTFIDVYVPKSGRISFAVYDIYGRELLEYSENISAGNHKFEIAPGKRGFLLLSVIFKNESLSLKMFSNGGENIGASYIKHVGLEQKTQTIKSIEAKSGFIFIVGDQLKYTGMSQFGIDTALSYPTQDSLVVFDFCGSKFCKPLFVDGRDGEIYKAVEIGNQCWMAENLAYLPSVNPSNSVSNNDAYYYVYGYNGTNIALAKQTYEYKTYGVLYNWTAAMNNSGSSNNVPSGVQGSCPDLWHIPSDLEWDTLMYYLGGWAVAGGKMKEAGLAHWQSPNNGATNSSGFTAIPGGCLYEPGASFEYMGKQASFWSSTRFFSSIGWRRMLINISETINRSDEDFSLGYSVRCIKDTCTVFEQADAGNDTLNIPCSAITLMANKPSNGKGYWEIISGGGGVFFDSLDFKTLFHGLSDSTYYLKWTIFNYCGKSSDTVVVSFDYMVQDCGVIIDSRDGNIYNTIQIGNQCWMAQNLAYLPSVFPSSDISSTSPRYYVYDYQGTNVISAKASNNYSIYGVIYNWLAAMDGTQSSDSVPSGVLGVCPSGWHLPSDEEWKILEGEADSQYGYPNSVWDMYGSRGSDAGGNLKEFGLDHWEYPNLGGTNTSHFTAIPGGRVHSFDGIFAGLGENICLWTATETSSSNSCRRLIFSGGKIIGRDGYSKDYGYYVRCVKD